MYTYICVHVPGNRIFIGENLLQSELQGGDFSDIGAGAVHAESLPVLSCMICVLLLDLSHWLVMCGTAAFVTLVDHVRHCRLCTCRLSDRAEPLHSFVQPLKTCCMCAWFRALQSSPVRRCLQIAGPAGMQALQHARAASKYLDALRAAGEAPYSAGREKQLRVLLQLTQSSTLTLEEASQLLLHCKESSHWSDEDFAALAAAVDSKTRAVETGVSAEPSKSTKTQDYQNFVHFLTAGDWSLLADAKQSDASRVQVCLQRLRSLGCRWPSEPTVQRLLALLFSLPAAEERVADPSSLYSAFLQLKDTAQKFLHLPFPVPQSFFP